MAVRFVTQEVRLNREIAALRQEQRQAARKVAAGGFVAISAAQQRVIDAHRVGFSVEQIRKVMS